MIKHVILWTIRDDYSPSEKEQIKKEIKDGLEGLKGQIPGLLDVQVQIQGLASSNADILLDSSLESVDALERYAKHPLHVAVADEKIRPFMASRVCLDFEA